MCGGGFLTSKQMYRIELDTDISATFICRAAYVQLVLLAPQQLESQTAKARHRLTSALQGDAYKRCMGDCIAPDAGLYTLNNAQPAT